LRGDWGGGALGHGQSALDHALATGVWCHEATCYISLAESLVESREHARALVCLEQAKSRIAGMRAPLFEFHICLIEATAALLQGDHEHCQETLGRALAFGREYGFIVTSRWLPKVMARLLAFALEHGIEPEYARSIIRKRNLVPESPEVENWPWPVMVYTLGRFVVVLDGGRTSLAGTAQGRPVELLQALIAAGGREVHSTALIDQLWPDADDGRKTLEINLHRLRKLLGCDQACILHEGKLTLDPRHCWVDTWAFERACNQISENADSEMKLEGVAEQVLRLYQGQFPS
jgi:LuxR family maltose regulon positive regulatory protein